MKKPIISLYPYQKAFLQDKNKLKMGLFARQTGKSFMVAVGILQDILAKEEMGQKTTWIYVSAGERQAKEFITSKMQPLLRGYSTILKELTGDDQKGTFSSLQLETTLGSRVIALPANPNTIRGYSGNVVLDEFAFHEDSKALMSAIFPVISSKKDYKMWIISTPNGKANKFYELWHSKNNFSKFKVDIIEALKQGLSRDIKELKEIAGDSDTWSQEYECKFLDEATSYFPYDLIAQNKHENAGIPKYYQEGSCYLGVDVAIRQDLFVATVVEVVGDIAWVREIVTLKRHSFYSQDKHIEKLNQKYKIIRIYIDQTGMGEKVVEDAKRKYGNSKVQGVLFNISTKQDLATNIKQLLEDKRVRLPFSKELEEDLHSIERSQSASGNPLFKAGRTSAGHSDRAWSLMLALLGLKQGQRVYEYEGIIKSKLGGRLQW